MWIMWYYNIISHQEHICTKYASTYWISQELLLLLVWNGWQSCFNGSNSTVPINKTNILLSSLAVEVPKRQETMASVKFTAQILHQLLSFTSIKLYTENYLIWNWKRQIQSIMQGQRIEIHILDEPPIKIINSVEGQKISYECTGRKNDDSAIKSSVPGTLFEEALFL